MSIHNKVAIITGAGRGVGRATAQLFAQKGAQVVLFSRTQTHLDETTASITHAGGNALAIVGDVAQEDDVQKLFQVARDTYGRVDILINCAGMVAVRPFVEMDVATWD
ncbi:MAG TPA: SDR family NAD(P)-dependent oxidoreductase, partial [Ktedonobacteraceae bacterium]